jgi:hypothetical protein
VRIKFFDWCEGSSRGFERSVSGGGWFERSNSATDEANGGNISPRKGYTRAPFDDWRKPTGGQLVIKMICLSIIKVILEKICIVISNVLIKLYTQI